jgi:hypothetical protein
MAKQANRSKNKDTKFFYKYLQYEMALPDTLIITTDCRNKHGVDGKTIRQRLDNVCVVCCREKWVRANRKRGLRKLIYDGASLRHKELMDLIDEQYEKSEEDLFLT